ncbi:hypothetical protein JG687_00003808 [Phytophthora cactorum]|uniref:Calponin-homology (CH) domain-containing protein n=1 Tax=Phytophthora cactorum TaxID=29920 RepID=A0A8T1UT11_9STRA|nr:hypothetical protein JG687_00003808 [Phytophthora cactorum]
MSGAYFVSRTELLVWLNTLCAIQLTTVEQASSGAVACQVLDLLYPGIIPMNRVNWTTTQPHECMHNYKLLQKSLLALHIDKNIPVDKLIRGKYQDNLEFLQWLKAFYDHHEPPLQPYDTSEAEFAAVLKKMQAMKIKSNGLMEERNALKAETCALREKAERVKGERDFYVNKLEAIAELVHDAELSKATNAQTNLLGLSILDVLFATEEDEGGE